METINKIGKSYKHKKVKKTPEHVNRQISLEHSVDKMKFLNETKKVELKRNVTNIINKQYGLFKYPESEGAKAYFNIEYSKMLKEITNNMIVDNAFK
jgi:predicted metal-dependent hydrolase